MRIYAGQLWRKVACLMFPAILLLGVAGTGLKVEAQSPAGSAPWTQRFVETIRNRSAGIQLRKIKTRGKPKVARWEDVDAQLASVTRLLDAKTLLLDLHPAFHGGVPQLTFESRAEIDQLLAECKVDYVKLFLIAEDDAYFPLTNSVLRLTNDEGFANLNVFEKSGFSLGTYAGKYIFEKTGGLSYGGGSYRLTFFQYRDNEGALRPSANTNLLDTYIVRWREVKDRAFLQLSIDALFR